MCLSLGSSGKPTGNVIGPQLFRCERCSYSSYRQHHLKRHQLTHSGEKPFACERCPFTSARLDALQAHRRSHARHDPLTCGVCAFAAKDSAALEVHLQLHHYPCHHCEVVAPTLKIEHFLIH
ncbi:zinc finger protein-like [Tropilaelaps mercedesae]|uniref:Zinc finger protein-like n=1 Tax=Tropilaelaps mercedesae TaxID=418985 RepID=A0A1V9XGQ5_9ACAR|nr:zinc finger protein-like [Tropilaelaps mercedesae]